jgi:hypothetical protein
MGAGARAANSAAGEMLVEIVSQTWIVLKAILGGRSTAKRGIKVL